MSAQRGFSYGTRFVFEDTGITVYSGTGSPEGVVIATVGDFYFRKDPAATWPSAPIYVKLTGIATATGWQAIATTLLGSATAMLTITDGVALGVAEWDSRSGFYPAEAVALGVADSYSKAVV